MFIALNVYALWRAGSVNAKKERRKPPSGGVNGCDERLVSGRQHLKVGRVRNNVH